jgi:hypothetical protein
VASQSSCERLPAMICMAWLCYCEVSRLTLLCCNFFVQTCVTMRTGVTAAEHATATTDTASANPNGPATAASA